MKKVVNVGFEIGWFAKDDQGRVYHTFEQPSAPSSPPSDEWHEVTNELYLDAEAFGKDESADLAYEAWKALYFLVKARP